jgi:hypothetical protein
VSARRTTRFRGLQVTTGQCGPSCGDGDGGSREGCDVDQMVEEEWDDAVPGRGDGMEVVRVAWSQRRRRGCGKFWLPVGVQVKILQFGFKDRTAGGFIGAPQ